MDKIRDDLGRILIGGAGCIGRGKDLLLDGGLVAEMAGGIAYLVIYASELFGDGVELGQ